MKTTDDLFQESIDQYKSLLTDASDLSKSMTELSLDEVLHRCNNLQERHNKQIKIDAFLIDVMLETGPEILNTPYIGEYQRILDMAILACDEVSMKAKAIRSTMQIEIKRLEARPKLES
ncbi:MAG: hypothetical protein KAI17_13365 [Thiotrichaceae bacterium]|nr:hypothetical protein [Thiotrichaceae bacterium]